MASGPITSWQTDGETVETMADFIFLGSKITADGDCSREIKRCLLIGRKAMTNLDSIFKSRDIADKGPSSQSYACMPWRAIPGPISKRKRRLDSLEAAQGAPRDPRRCIPGSPGESGLVSRGSQGLRSPLESRRGALGAP